LHRWSAKTFTAQRFGCALHPSRPDFSSVIALWDPNVTPEAEEVPKANLILTCIVEMKPCIYLSPSPWVSTITQNPPRRKSSHRSEDKEFHLRIKKAPGPTSTLRSRHVVSSSYYTGDASVAALPVGVSCSVCRACFSDKNSQMRLLYQTG
jgi:hypothetical protein